MVYDVDGEGSQPENLRTYLADGLISYQTGTSAQSLVASTDGNSVLFTGNRVNYPESDTTGAVILQYANTSQFTLNFESETFYCRTPNVFFSAIDGDLSMGTGGFAASESLPNTGSTAAFLELGYLLLLLLGGDWDRWLSHNPTPFALARLFEVEVVFGVLSKLAVRLLFIVLPPRSSDCGYR